MNKTTIRVSPQIAAQVAAEMGNLAAGGTRFIEAYCVLRAQGIRELKKMFSLAELKLMLDAENGVIFSPSLIGGFVGHIYDAMALDHLDTKWGVDRSAIMDKLESLPLSTMVVLEEWLNHYWYGKLKPRPPIDEYLS